MSQRNLWCVSLAAASLGCGGHTLDVGSMDGGSASGDLRQDAGAGGPAGSAWNGILENAQLSNGSNRLTMTLSLAPDGGATGTLLLGDGALLLPPTDPNVGYPPGAEFSTFSSPGPLGLFEGFRYTMLDGRVSGSKLTFRVAAVELWTQWCSLQTSYPWLRGADGGWEVYSCAPSSDGSNKGPTGCWFLNPSTMQDTPIDCGKFGLCQTYACDCSPGGCRGRPLTALTELTSSGLSFDLVVTGTTADGTVSGELGDHDVHFVRGQ